MSKKTTPEVGAKAPAFSAMATGGREVAHVTGDPAGDSDDCVGAGPAAFMDGCAADGSTPPAMTAAPVSAADFRKSLLRKGGMGAPVRMLREM